MMFKLSGFVRASTNRGWAGALKVLLEQRQPALVCRRAWQTILPMHPRPIRTLLCLTIPAALHAYYSHCAILACRITLQSVMKFFVTAAVGVITGGSLGMRPPGVTSVLALFGVSQTSFAVSGSTAFVPLHAGLFAFAISSMEHWLFEHKNAWTRRIMWDASQQHLLPYGVLRGALAHCAFSVTLVLIAAGLVSAWRKCVVVKAMKSAGVLRGTRLTITLYLVDAWRKCRVLHAIQDLCWHAAGPAAAGLTKPMCFGACCS